jgi:pantetheine-phosphate adenylyltransferase
LRTSNDFEYERQIGQMNKHLNENIETVFLLTMPEHTFVSSTIIREITKYKSDVSKFVPKIIADDIHRLEIRN